MYWSFPNFCIEDIKNQEWEESEVFLYLSEQRILMQIFVEEEGGYVYRGHLFLKLTPEQLKAAIMNGQCEVVNMTLTSDGRLLGSASNKPKINVIPK